MDKTTVEFLLKVGYTLPEIIAMSQTAENAPKIVSTEKKGDNIPEDKKPSTETAEAQQTASTDLEQKLNALREEIATLRGTMQERNRNETVVETAGKQLTLEDEVEQMLKEVNA